MSDGDLKGPSGFSGCAGLFNGYDDDEDEGGDKPGESEWLLIPGSMPEEEREALRALVEDLD
jgi:hypothetical protein